MRIGFCGSRSLAVTHAPLIRQVVGAYAMEEIHTGCANGADRMVREAAIRAGASLTVFKAKDETGSFVARLVKRSIRCVRSVDIMIGFADTQCPVHVVPGPAWVSGHGSGTWASLALAAGLQKKVMVFWCGNGLAQLPSWPGGEWKKEGGWLWKPAPGQMSLW